VGANYAAPTIQEIKTAIYQYGPVESMVCVGNGFTNYRSGTFTQDESGTCQNGYVNHAVVLVGWDDSRGPNGSWILRNSWGPGWGDKGYMYIDRTVSNIGYFTSYIEYTPQQKLFIPFIRR
jgi:inhibitor of cysteine peptidase